MDKRVTLAIICVTALAYAPIATTAHAAATEKSANLSKRSAATPAAEPVSRSADRSQRKSTSQRKRSRERIYTVTPEMIEAMEAKTVRNSRRGSAIAAADDVPFVGFNPANNAIVGVGLWRVPKMNRSDPNRNNPLRSTRGKTGRAAAVGMQVVF